MSGRSLSASPKIVENPAHAPVERRHSLGDDRFWRWASFSPALLLMLALSVLPLVNLFWMSFYNVTWAGGRATWTLVGLDHYRAVLDDKLFRAGMVNTVVFAIAAVAGQMVLGFAVALLCSRVTRGRVVYRAIFILPI